MSATTFIISGNDQEQMEPPVDSSDVDDESLNGKTIDFEPSPTKPDDNALKKFFFTLWIPTYYHLVVSYRIIDSFTYNSNFKKIGISTWLGYTLEKTSVY